MLTNTSEDAFMTFIYFINARKNNFSVHLLTKQTNIYPNIARD